jgi:hypothetical protein
LRPRNSLAVVAVALLSLSGCSLRPPDTGVFLDPSLAPLIPADTTLILGARVEKLSQTPLFSVVANLDMIGGFAREAGVDAASRLWQVLLVSNGRRSIVLGHGKFTNGIIAPELARKGGTRFAYRGMNLFGDEQNAVLFINSSTAIWGQTPVLRDIADQKGTGSGPPARLATLMKEIPRETQLWGAYAGGTVNFPLSGNAQNLTKVLGMLSAGMFYFDLTSGVNGLVTGVAANAQDAQQVHDALEGFIGLGRMMAPKNQPDLQRLFDGVHVTQEAQRVRVQIVEPEDLAAKLIGLLPKQ